MQEIDGADENLLEDIGSQSQPMLIPELQPENAQEPDYNVMDNLTLLSSLNLHDNTNTSNNDHQNLLSDLIN